MGPAEAVFLAVEVAVVVHFEVPLEEEVRCVTASEEGAESLAAVAWVQAVGASRAVPSVAVAVGECAAPPWQLVPPQQGVAEEEEQPSQRAHCSPPHERLKAAVAAAAPGGAAQLSSAHLVSRSGRRHQTEVAK